MANVLLRGISACEVVDALMKKILLASALAISSVVACAETFKAGDRVSFFGDSITHGGVWHRNVILYYLTRFPDRDVAFMNSGSGGDNAANALKVRLEPDVVARKPTDVVVMFGMNDFGFREYGTNATPAQVARQAQRLSEYARNMDLLVSVIEKVIPGVRLYLMTPTPFDDTAVYPDGKKVNEHPGANGGLTAAAQVVAELADRTGATLVDLNAAVNAYFRAERQKDDGVTFASDSIHPNSATHFMMAHRFLEAQNAPRVVSDVKLQAGRVLGARNAEVSDVKWTEGRVSFTLLEKSLPWPVDAEARRGGETILRAADDFNQEVLALYGLADGEWTLKIDGVTVASASARQWEIGVDLGGNEKTPQYRQALEVAHANHGAHDRMAEIQATNVSIIRHITDRMLHEKLDPADAAAREAYVQKRLPTLQPWDVPRWKAALRDWDDNDRLIRSVDEFWPKLRAQAKPRPHFYELTVSTAK